MYSKDLSPRVLLPILGTRRCEYPRLSEESEKESSDEATHRAMEELYQKQFGRR